MSGSRTVVDLGLTTEDRPGLILPTAKSSHGKKGGAKWRPVSETPLIIYNFNVCQNKIHTLTVVMKGQIWCTHEPGRKHAYFCSKGGHFNVAANEELLPSALNRTLEELHVSELPRGLHWSDREFATWS